MSFPSAGSPSITLCWIRSRPRFFLPIQVLRRVFRGKFVAALKSAFQHGQLHLSGDLALLAQPKIFAAWLRPLFRKDWIVYSKPPFGGPEYVLQYLGRYTHRVAISNHRLLNFDQERVTFRWKDYAHGGKQGTMTLGATEFLRRFFRKCQGKHTVDRLSPQAAWLRHFPRSPIQAFRLAMRRSTFST